MYYKAEYSCYQVNSRFRGFKGLIPRQKCLPFEAQERKHLERMMVGFVRSFLAGNCVTI
jgi:hypothetical protein